MTAKHQFLALSKILNRFNDGEKLDLSLLDEFSLEPDEKVELAAIDPVRLACDRRKRKSLYILKIKNDYPFLSYFLEQNNFFDTFLDNYAAFKDEDSNNCDRILRFLHKYPGKYHKEVQGIGDFERLKQKFALGTNFTLQKKLPSVRNNSKLPENTILRLGSSFLPTFFKIDILDYLRAYFSKSHADIKQTEKCYIFSNENKKLSFFEISKLDFILLNEFLVCKSVEQGVETAIKISGISSIRNIMVSQLQFFYSIGVVEQADEKF